jgi:hypothetical protein
MSLQICVHYLPIDAEYVSPCVCVCVCVFVFLSVVVSPLACGVTKFRTTTLILAPFIAARDPEKEVEERSVSARAIHQTDWRA